MRNRAQSDGKQRNVIATSPDWRRKVFGLTEDCHAVVRACEASELFAKKLLSNTRHDTEGRLRVHLILAGSNGVGKTHLARRVAHYVRDHAVNAWDTGKWHQPPTVTYASWPELMASEAEGVWLDVVNADLAVIDEVGGETDQYRSGEPTRKLSTLLDKREKKWCLFTTNVPPDQWATVWDKRVADRLRRSSRTAELTTLLPWTKRSTQ